MDLTGKVALVTGGASGIGLETAKELLRNGIMGLAILDLKIEKHLYEELNSLARVGLQKIIFINVDVTNHKEFEDAFKNTLKEFGRIDIVVNNAGICSPDDLRVINVNLTASVMCVLLSNKYMGKNNGGQGGIVATTASVLGFEPIDLLPVYNTTKHGVIGLIRSFGQAYHYEKTGIKYVALCPGVTQTTLLKNLDSNDVSFANRLKEILDTYPNQEPDCCGRAMNYIIKNGQNGSCWVIEGGDLFEVNVPTRQEISKLVVANI